MSADVATPTPNAGRRRVNLTVMAEYLKEAREFGLNLSQVLEESLRAALKSERERRWHEENRAAIEKINARIEREGLWHKGLTAWY
jgi:antitoxin CcdA